MRSEIKDDKRKFRNASFFEATKWAGIVNRYGLDDPGRESRCRRGFPARQPTLLCTGYRVTFPGLKRPGHGFDHTPYLASRLKKVLLYLYSPSRSLWPVPWRNLLQSSVAETTFREGVSAVPRDENA